MIFQENSSSSNELILPPITSSKTEVTAETKPKQEKVENETKEENKESSVNTDLAKSSETNPQSTVISPNLLQNNKTLEVNKIEKNISRDQEINRYLEYLGWSVIRFWGKEIKKNPDGCIQEIKDLIFYKALQLNIE